MTIMTQCASGFSDALGAVDPKPSKVILDQGAGRMLVGMTRSALPEAEGGVELEL